MTRQVVDKEISAGQWGGKDHWEAETINASVLCITPRKKGGRNPSIFAGIF